MPISRASSASSTGNDITEKPPPIEIVVGVDFGTCYSGISYIVVPGGQLAAHGLSVSGQVFCHTDWPHAAFNYPKTPTALLYRTDVHEGVTMRCVEAWGWEAQHKYAALPAEQVHPAGPYHLFKHFKLHLEPGCAGAARAGALPAGWRVETLVKDYLTKLRRYTKEVLCAQFDEVVELRDENIRWCLTVPALWSEAAKDTMRSAAAAAGMVILASMSPARPLSERLLLTLEPEAAALAALHASSTIVPSAPATAAAGSSDLAGSSSGGCSAAAAAPQLSGNEQVLTAGDVVCVVDVGGGTSDITTHKVVQLELQEGTGSRALCLEEAVAGSGDFHAGLRVDAAFLRLCKESFSNWDAWAVAHGSELHEFMGRWQDAKRTFSGSSSVRLSVPQGLTVKTAAPASEEQDGADIFSLFDTTPADDDGWERVGRPLDITAETMASLYDDTIDDVIAQAKVVMEDAANNGMPCNKVLLAGGFCCSAYAQFRLRDALQSHGCSVITLQRPASAVVEGAVHYAMQPGAISARRARFAYGVRTASLLTESMKAALGAEWQSRAFRHAEDGELRVRGVFSRYVRRGELVAAEHEVVRTYSPLFSSATCAEFVLYQTMDNGAMFTFNEDMHELAKVEMRLPVGWAASRAWRVERFYPIQCRLRFGATALTVSAVDQQTGEQVDTRVEFRRSSPV